MGPSVVGVSILNLSSERLFWRFAVELLYPTSVTYGKWPHPSVTQQSSVLAFFLGISPYIRYGPNSFLVGRGLNCWFPGPWHVFSLFGSWSRICGADGLWGSLWLENSEQSSSGGQHPKSAFLRVLWRLYCNILSCILNAGQWGLGQKRWYMNT